MSKKILSLLIILLFFAAGIACAEGYSRIISIAPSATESLYALGLGDKLIALTIYCPNPYALDSIGTTLEPNIEQIVYLEPDLVIGCEEANSTRTIDKLKSLGLNVFFIEKSKDFTDICRNFILLGATVDKKEFALTIIKKAKDELDLIRQRTEKYPVKKVFWEVGARPLITINRESFVDEMIKFSGGINIFSKLKSKYPRINHEEVLKINPDIIILTTMGDVSSEEILRWKKYKTISAVKDNQIHIIDSSLVCWPIPANFVKGVRYVSNIIHPDIKNEK